MADAQNIFYTSISKYYSEIFPYNPAQLKFVEAKLSGLSGKTILDIGCATGELAYNLALGGASVTGIDLNEDLLEQAQENKIHPNLHFQKGNMLNLETDFPATQFDAVLCFGNTLVHLKSLDDVTDMLKATRIVLKPGGTLLLQILNYDYILEDKVTELPCIDAENITFLRHYQFRETGDYIDFQTELVLKHKVLSIRNETRLLALKSKDLLKALTEAGFSEINLYSNFKQDPFGGKHLPLVVSCI
ncbi:class I SAM-dependent methyltransferase [Maribellus sp. YY47]|uniref:class I SAM-dependent methyltransferase n=1 Tax=Maribellus sp. YY47 TaxID=2929486 RepID=UPI002000DA03|nr:class I SAM-dependent methyltransferase [Maribellus sp. YY47]MCK3684099.1 class I SAM-dependent methyltransferase [Maribellus sp. YY47]